MKEFQVGDRVKWATEKARDTSRDKGNYGYKAKEIPIKNGIVVEVVPAGTRPALIQVGLPSRNHCSYVVRSKGGLFWPPVSRMERIDE